MFLTNFNEDYAFMEFKSDIEKKYTKNLYCDKRSGRHDGPTTMNRLYDKMHATEDRPRGKGDHSIYGKGVTNIKDKEYNDKLNAMEIKSINKKISESIFDFELL